MPALNLTTKD